MGPDSRPDDDHLQRPLYWPATVTINTGDDDDPFQLVVGSATSRDELRRLIQDSEAADEPVLSIVVNAGAGRYTTEARWQPGTITTTSHRHGWTTRRHASTDPVDGIDETIAAAGADGRPLCEYCPARAQRQPLEAGRWACRAHRHLAALDAARDPDTDLPLRLDSQHRVVFAESGPTKAVLCGTCGHGLVLPADTYTCPLCTHTPTTSQADRARPQDGTTGRICDPCRYGRHAHQADHAEHCECFCTTGNEPAHLRTTIGRR